MTQELLKLKKVPASENKQIFKNTIRSVAKGKSDLVSDFIDLQGIIDSNEQDFFSYLIAQHNNEEKVRIFKNYSNIQILRSLNLSDNSSISLIALLFSLATWKKSILGNLPIRESNIYLLPVIKE